MMLERNKQLMWLLLLIAFACLASRTPAQVAEERVCISRAAATSCLEAQDRAEALSAEIKAKDAAIDALKAEINTLRVNLAETSGKLSAQEQQRVRDAAIIELLLKYTRPKKIGLINLF